MTRARRNIELKSRCPDLAAAQAAAAAVGARPAGLLRQVDTYFHCRQGRLKLRQINNDRAELIWYARPDDPAARASDYHLYPVPDAASLLTILSQALGVRQVVEKRRELLLWENVRIHLDDVAGRGTFVEFEAVLQQGDDESASYARLEKLAAALKLSPEDRIATSYGDM
jgi:predicted adenylyl cyclase CyaB